MINMFSKLVAKFGPEVNRVKYPKNLYGDWEFIPQPDGTFIARVYSVPFREERFSNIKSAQKWVHENMVHTKKVVQ